MMRKERRGLILLGLVGLLCPGLLNAQEQQPPPPPPTQDTVSLVFEREVFFYPTFERRNPFARVVSGTESGPRFEEIELIGIIFSPDPSLSVAVFGPRGRGEQADQQQQARRTYRARRGQQLGNVRILEIQRTRVVVEVDEFGLTEQRIMELQRPGQGGSS